jgi:hypothetical protein
MINRMLAWLGVCLLGIALVQPTQTVVRSSRRSIAVAVPGVVDSRGATQSRLGQVPALQHLPGRACDEVGGLLSSLILRLA